MSYAGGQQTIIFDPSTRIRALVPGEAGELKPGAKIFGLARGGRENFEIRRQIAVGHAVDPP